MTRIYTIVFCLFLVFTNRMLADLNPFVTYPGTYTKIGGDGPSSFTFSGLDGGLRPIGGSPYLPPYRYGNGYYQWYFYSSFGYIGLYQYIGPTSEDDLRYIKWAYYYNANNLAASSDTKRVSDNTGPVDFGSGAETYSHSMLSINGASRLELEISYNSLLSAANIYITNPSSGFAPYWLIYTPGDLGHWSHNFEGHAQYAQVSYSSVQSSGQVTIILNHRRWIFTQNGTNWVNSKQDSLYDNLTSNGYDYIMTTKDQTSYTFSATNSYYLTQIKNPHGQILTISRNTNNPSQIISVNEPVSGKKLIFTYGENGAASSLVTTVSDSSGRQVHFAYDSNSMITNVIEANGLNTSYTYDTNRQMLTESDSHGNILTANQYDANFRVIQQTDARGNQFHFSYTPLSDSNGLVTNMTTLVTDRNGNATTYVFDGNYNLLSVTTPLGEKTTSTYNAAGLVTSTTDPLGHTTTFTYDASGNPTRILDAMGYTTTMGYDGAHNLLALTNADGNVTSFTYDSNNNLLVATDGLGRRITRTYNSNSLLITQSSPKGGVSSNSYTGGMLVQHTDPAGNKTKFAYDSVGNLTSITDPTNSVTTIHYGPLREVTETDDALNHRTLITYDWRMRKSSVTDPSGAVTSYSYDGNNNITSITNALGQVSTFGYDNEDRPVSVTDPLGHTASIGYDQDGRKSSTVDAAGDQSDFYYDAAGNLTSLVDAMGNTFRNSYDSRNQITSSTDPLGRSSSIYRDGAGRLLATVDPLYRVNKFVNDALGKTTSATDPSGAVTGQSFDQDGNRSSLMNANRKATTFTYDKSDRLTVLTTALGLKTTYTYNSRNLPATQNQPDGSTTTITYDSLGRPSLSSDPVGTIAHTYDNCGRPLISSETSGGTTRSLSRQYDALGRLTNFTDAGGNSIGYSYDAAGRLTTLTYPDGKQVTYGYDSANRLTTVTDWAQRVTTYGYDSNSKVISIQRPDQTLESFRYDSAGQILSSTDVGVTNLQVISYSYNSVGLITNESILPAPSLFTPSPLTFAVDADNRLTNINGQSVGYDANGNMTNAVIPGSAITNLTYDARNRLTSAGGLTYGYDPENRRISVTSGSGKTSYVFNPNNALDQVLVKTAADGTVTRYVYGLGLIGEETSGNFTTYHYDYRGSTTALTDIHGTVTQRFSYGPNGEPVGFNPATAPTQFLYNGRYGVMTDTNGLNYMRARYYSPNIARFINQDVVLGSVGSAPSMNRFAYANGDPINKNDPFGLAAKPTASMSSGLWTTALGALQIATGAALSATPFAPLGIFLAATGAAQFALGVDKILYSTGTLNNYGSGIPDNYWALAGWEGDILKGEGNTYEEYGKFLDNIQTVATFFTPGGELRGVSEMKLTESPGVLKLTPNDAQKTLNLAHNIANITYLKSLKEASKESFLIINKFENYRTAISFKESSQASWKIYTEAPSQK